MSWFKPFWKALTVAPAADGLSSSEVPSNFTPRAQQVLALAGKEADRLHHNFVGTEHLLLGLTRLGQGTAANVLERMGLDLETVRIEVEKQVGAGPDKKFSGHLPYTPRTKKVLALAAKEARALSHTYVGTEHVLLGLLLEGDGVAARVLKALGVDTEKARVEILRELDPNFAGPAGGATPSGQRPPADLPRTQPGSVDPSKRYDVYCSERNQQVIVYRNALFKGRTRLFSTGPHDFAAEFLELEQSSGQTVYLSRLSVVKFCDHGADVVGEIIPPG